jgi:hypothetical protein
MGDDGSGDLFALGLNSCRQVVSLLEGHQGIDQDGVLITGDQCGGARWPARRVDEFHLGPPSTWVYSVLNTSMVSRLTGSTFE